MTKAAHTIMPKMCHDRFAPSAKIDNTGRAEKDRSDSRNQPNTCLSAQLSRRPTKAPIEKTQEVLPATISVIRIEPAIIPENNEGEITGSVDGNETIERASRFRSHVDQQNDGEPPCGTPQPSLVEERPGLDQVKDDKQG
jgi:hypothetical protein